MVATIVVGTLEVCPCKVHQPAPEVVDIQVESKQEEVLVWCIVALELRIVVPWHSAVVEEGSEVVVGTVVGMPWCVASS